MKAILALVCGSACLLSVSAAKADITFCNNHGNEIFVSVGFINLNDTLNCTSRFEEAEMMGWWTVMPGQCTTTFSGCYPADEIEYHAEAADGTHWAGSDTVTLSNEVFDFCEHTSPLVCANNDCPPMDHGKSGFRTVLLDNNCFSGADATFDLN